MIGTPKILRQNKKKVLFIGSAVYDFPFNTTIDKKINALEEISENYFFAFTNQAKLFPLRQKNFFLLPNWKNQFSKVLYFWISSFIYTLYFLHKNKNILVIAQGPGEGLSIAILKLFLKFNFVVEIHGDWKDTPLLYKKRLFPKIFSWFNLNLSNFVLHRADKIRTISDFLTKKITKLFPAKKIITFPTYTDIEKFLVPNPNFEKIEKDLIFIGQLTYLKGLDVLIEAIALLKNPNIKITIVGIGDYEAILRKKINAKNLTSNFKFVGTKNTTELPTLIQKHKALVLPSFSEGLGRVLIEALACYRPVIGSRVGGIPDIINDGENGFLFSAGNAVMLSQKINLILKNLDLIKKMGEAGQNLVKKNFSTEKYIAGYQKLIYK